YIQNLIMKRSNNNGNQSYNNIKKARHNPNNSSDNVPLAGATPRLNQPINQFSKADDANINITKNLIGRTVCLRNLPSDAEAHKLINQIKVGPLESVRFRPENSYALISFMSADLAKTFYDEVMTKLFFYEGQELRASWGEPSAIPERVQLAMNEKKVSRNVFLKNLDGSFTEETLYRDLAEYGSIDTVEVVKKGKIGYVHFLNISNAVKAVTLLPSNPAYERVKIGYAKDRCARYMKNPPSRRSIALQGFGNAAALEYNMATRDSYPNATTTHNSYLNATTTHNSYLNATTTHNSYLNAMSAHNPYLNTTSARNPYLNATSACNPYLNAMSSACTLFRKVDDSNKNQDTLIVENIAGAIKNVGNRTIYLGNLHPETTCEDLCNVIRGGILQHIRFIPGRHVAFVTFIDPNSASNFMVLARKVGVVVKNRRLKVGWGGNPGPLPRYIKHVVNTRRASRNIYIGKLDEQVTEEKLRKDFEEYGKTEFINLVKESSCGFVNFMSISSAINAMEHIPRRDDYKNCYINYGKDRCGNAPKNDLELE
ncbi:17657_t:CDS:2, partial [Entrophospora sp. SA101]